MATLKETFSMNHPCPYKVRLLSGNIDYFGLTPRAVVWQYVAAWNNGERYRYKDAEPIFEDQVKLVFDESGADHNGSAVLWDNQTPLWKMLKELPANDPIQANSILWKALVSYFGNGAKKKLAELGTPANILAWLREKPFEVLRTLGWTGVPEPRPVPVPASTAAPEPAPQPSPTVDEEGITVEAPAGSSPIGSEMSLEEIRRMMESMGTVQRPVIVAPASVDLSDVTIYASNEAIRVPTF